MSRVAADAAPPVLVFMWEQFSAYHIDRLDALGVAYGDRARVVGIEVASRSRTYAWDPIEGAAHYERHTLFPDQVADDIGWRRKFKASRSLLRALRPAAVFLCNQEQPEILALLALLRLRGVRTYAMLDAKFDDTPRRVAKEWLKPAVFRLFTGGLVSGDRSADYYRFLGLPGGWSQPGYDTVSVARVRALVGGRVAPEGAPHAARDFVSVARFVPKKNLVCAIQAYAAWRAMRPAHPRRLVLCGSGPLEAMLRDECARLGVTDGVIFPGFLGPEEVARQLADGLAFVLPSVEEQWGLVVNEAVALGLPILCSDNVGARDTLVRVGQNGFVFEPHNPDGLAGLMFLVSEDERLWRRFCHGSQRLALAGDVVMFVAGVEALTGVPVPDPQWALPQTLKSPA